MLSRNRPSAETRNEQTKLSPIGDDPTAWVNSSLHQEGRVCGCVCRSVVRVRLFVIPWTVARQALLFSPGKNTGMGCHSRLQRIFLTRGIEPGSPALRVDSLLTGLPGKPSPSRAHGPNQHLQNLRPRPLPPAWVEMHLPRLTQTLTRSCTSYKPAGAPPRKPAQAPHSGSHSREVGPEPLTTPPCQRSPFIGH